MGLVSCRCIYRRRPAFSPVHCQYRVSGVVIAVEKLSRRRRRKTIDATAFAFNPLTPTVAIRRQSARMPKLTNDGLTRSGTGCFVAVLVWQLLASKGLLNVVRRQTP